MVWGVYRPTTNVQCLHSISMHSAFGTFSHTVKDFADLAPWIAEYWDTVGTARLGQNIGIVQIVSGTIQGYCRYS